MKTIYFSNSITVLDSNNNELKLDKAVISLEGSDIPYPELFTYALPRSSFGIPGLLLKRKEGSELKDIFVPNTNICCIQEEQEETKIVKEMDTYHREE